MASGALLAPKRLFSLRKTSNNRIPGAPERVIGPPERVLGSQGRVVGAPEGGSWGAIEGSWCARGDS